MFVAHLSVTGETGGVQSFKTFKDAITQVCLYQVFILYANTREIDI